MKIDTNRWTGFITELPDLAHLLDEGDRPLSLHSGRTGETGGCHVSIVTMGTLGGLAVTRGILYTQPSGGLVHLTVWNVYLLMMILFLS